MPNEIGPQYSKDHPFITKARLHQSKFHAEILDVDYETYGSVLEEVICLSEKNYSYKVVRS